MSKETIVTDEPIVEEVTINPEEVLAYVVKREDGYHVIDQDGTEGPVCNRRTTDGYIILTPNAANRKCVNEKNAEKFFAEHPDGRIELTYKATRKLGESVAKMPNAKLITYLPEELQEEYKAIIADAMTAKQNAEKGVSDVDKAKYAAEMAKYKYEVLAGTRDEADKPVKPTSMRKNIIEYIAEDKYDRYTELLDMAEKAKADAPKAERKPRGPMTQEQKVARAKAAAEKAQAKLDALLAAEGI